MGQIYKIYNDINNLIYVGLTHSTAEERFHHHCTKDLYDNTYLHRAMKKYGVKHFFVETLERDVPDEMLSEREIYWIAKLNCKAPNGYNMTSGGENNAEALRAYWATHKEENAELGKKNFSKWRQEHPEEALRISRENLSNWEKTNPEKFRELCRENQRKYLIPYWREHREENLAQLAKNRETCLDKAHEMNKKKVLMIDKNDHEHIIRQFDSVKEAAIFLNIPGNNGCHISGCCKGTRKSAYGYFWRYVEE